MSLTRLFPEFNTLLNPNPFAAMGDPFPRSWNRVPPMDLDETQSAYIVKADVPGFKKDQIEINASGTALTLTGRYKVQETIPGVYRHNSERNRSNFQRTINLPMEIPVDKIIARMEDGVLTLEIPKSSVHPKRVTIV
jgi:HSP20 family protein